MQTVSEAVRNAFRKPESPSAPARFQMCIRDSCKAIGVDKVVQDSSGNAGNSVAAYCAKAGIACEIFVPEGTSPKKIDMICAHGATCTVVPGTRDHCADVCRAKVEQEGVYYANHVYNPFFYEGTKRCV